MYIVYKHAVCKCLRSKASLPGKERMPQQPQTHWIIQYCFSHDIRALHIRWTYRQILYCCLYQVIFCNKKWAKALAKDGLLFKARSPDLRISFQLGQASIQFGCQNGPMKVSKNKNWKQKTQNLNVQPPQNEFWLSLIICGLFDADVRRKWRHGVRKSLAQICRPRWPIFGVKEF